MSDEHKDREGRENKKEGLSSDDFNALFGFSKEPAKDESYGFQPEQPNTGYNPESNPRGEYQKVKKKDNAMKVLYVVLAVFGAVFLFFMGFMTKHLTTDSSTRAFDWAMGLIDEYYIGDALEGQHYTREDYLLRGFSLLDKYSAFLTPEEVKAENASMGGDETGFGFTVDNSKDVDGDGVKDIRVANVDMNSPSDGKIFEGDLIYSLNGEKSDAEDIQGTVSKYVKYGENAFIVKRPYYQSQGNRITYSETQVTVDYESYKVSYLKYYDKESDGAPAGLDDKTAYIKFKQFNAPADTEFITALNAFRSKGRANLILDMRGNPGGYVKIAQFFGRYLVGASGEKQPLLATARYKNGYVEEIRAGENHYSEYGFQKIVVLVDENSASCSEMLLGAMIDSGSVDCIVGQKTYGKGIMQITQVHSAIGCGIRLTAASWYTPLGTGIHHNGFDPTAGYTVEKSARNYPYTFEGDAQLAKAFEYLAA